MPSDSGGTCKGEFARATPLREKKEYADREGADRTASLCIRRGNKSMYDVLKLHDEMLDFENNIHEKMEELAHYRSLLSCMNYEVVLKVVNGVLADIIHEAERYKEFIEEKEEQVVRNG